MRRENKASICTFFVRRATSFDCVIIPLRHSISRR